METPSQTITRLSSPLLPEPTDHPTRLTPLPDIRAVIFDIYGTLLISGSGDVGPAAAEDDEQALLAALDDAGLPPPASGRGTEILHREILAAQARRREQGIEFPEIDILSVWQQVLTALDLPAPSARQLQTFALSYECRVNPVWPMPNMAQTLSGIRDLGLAMGIVSNAQFYTPTLLQHFSGMSLDTLGFRKELCVWSWREQEGKPSRALFKKVLRPLQAQHGITPQQTLYVGNDRLKDIWPAASLGMRTALFAADRRSLRLREDDPRCNTVQPDVIIDDLGQLPAIIAGPAGQVR